MPALTLAEACKAMCDLLAENPDRATDPLVMWTPEGEYAEAHGIEDGSCQIGGKRIGNAVIVTH